MSERASSAINAQGDDAVIRRGDLVLVPMSLRAANAWVDEVHRHHGPVRGHKFSIGVEAHGELVGVAIAGRPVSRHLDDGRTLEVLRVATVGAENGAKNVCSMLYSAIARAAVAMGYERHRVITYTLDEEQGTSLRAAGWTPEHVSKAENWDRPSRERDPENHPDCRKVRWHASPTPEEAVA